MRDARSSGFLSPANTICIWFGIVLCCERRGNVEASARSISFFIAAAATKRPRPIQCPFQQTRLGARDVLLRVEQVVVERILAPLDRLLLVGLAVGKVGHGARGAAEQAAQVGALLVFLLFGFWDGFFGGFSFLFRRVFVLSGFCAFGEGNVRRGGGGGRVPVVRARAREGGEWREGARGARPSPSSATSFLFFSCASVRPMRARNLPRAAALGGCRGVPSGRATRPRYLCPPPGGSRGLHARPFGVSPVARGARSSPRARNSGNPCSSSLIQSPTCLWPSPLAAVWHSVDGYVWAVGCVGGGGCGRTRAWGE